jgi:predicted DNA-binding transcriptional regulator AlpA
MKRSLDELERCNREFLTTGEVIEFLGISKSMFYKSKDSFPFRVEKVGKKMLVPKREFIDFVKGRKEED